MSANWVHMTPPPGNRLSTLPRGRPARASAGDEVVDAMLQRVRAEYLEMPGLSLTLEQACCLWDLDREVCARLVDRLVGEGFLTQTSHDTYVRADGR